MRPRADNALFAAHRVDSVFPDTKTGWVIERRVQSFTVDSFSLLTCDFNTHGIFKTPEGSPRNTRGFSINMGFHTSQFFAKHLRVFKEIPKKIVKWISTRPLNKPSKQSSTKSPVIQKIIKTVEQTTETVEHKIAYCSSILLQ